MTTRSNYRSALPERLGREAGPKRAAGKGRMATLLLAVAALAAVTASCGKGEREYLSWRGLSLGLHASEFADSLAKRGFELDTLQTTAQLRVYRSPKENYIVALTEDNDLIGDLFEQYNASYNDSTAQLWQQMHDQFEKELGMWPGMTHRADLHKEAVFDTKKGSITLTLLNTYTPQLTVHYSNTPVENMR